MNKKLFLVICLFLFFSFCLVFADEAPTDDKNWGVKPVPQNAQSPLKKIPPAEKTWEDEKNDAIYEDYGSEDSPAFLNREKMNPNESDYDYGSPDGE